MSDFSSVTMGCMRRSIRDRNHDDDGNDVDELACNDTDFKAVDPDGYPCWHYLTKHDIASRKLRWPSSSLMTMRYVCEGSETATTTMTTLARNDTDFNAVDFDGYPCWHFIAKHCGKCDVKTSVR